MLADAGAKFSVVPNKLDPGELQPDMEFRVTLWELGDGPKTESPVEATDSWSFVGVEKAPAEIRAELGRGLLYCWDEEFTRDLCCAATPTPRMSARNVRSPRAHM